jgi:hypothetical protein
MKDAVARDLPPPAARARVEAPVFGLVAALDFAVSLVNPG